MTLQTLNQLDVDSALIFSDVHLSDDTPALTDALIHWLSGQFSIGPTNTPAISTSAPASLSRPLPTALLILGDLFDLWVGDDSMRSSSDSGSSSGSGSGSGSGSSSVQSATRLAELLSQIAAQGVRVGLMHGNRDFLLGSAFAEQAGAFLMQDPFVLRVRAGMTLALTHGDQLCTADTAYQAFRQQVRQPGWQQEFLAKPLTERLAIATALRNTSESEKSHKPMQIMDVTVTEAALLTAQLNADLLLHGHTHRPGCSPMSNGKLRWVLPDWSAGEASPPRGGGLWVDAGGVAPVAL